MRSSSVRKEYLLCVSSWFSLAMTLAEQKDSLTDHRAPFCCVGSRHGGWWARQQVWWNPACAFPAQVIFSVIDLFWTSAMAEEGGFGGKPEPVMYNEVLMNWKVAFDMPRAEMLTAMTRALQEKVSKMTAVRTISSSVFYFILLQCVPQLASV